MREFVVAPAELLGGWVVKCGDDALGSHFTQGLAVAEALKRAQAERDAGRSAVVLLREHPGRCVELAALTVSP